MEPLAATQRPEASSPAMSSPRDMDGDREADIDLERVVYDPEYRRWARDRLNRSGHLGRSHPGPPRKTR